MPAIPVLITIRSSAHREQAAEDETISMLTSGQLELRKAALSSVTRRRWMKACLPSR